MTKYLIVTLACLFALSCPAAAQITPESSRDEISKRIAKAYAELSGLIHSVPGKQYISACHASWQGKAVNAPEVCSHSEANIVRLVLMRHLRACGDFAERVESSASRTPWKQASSGAIWTDRQILSTCEEWARRVKVYGPLYRD